MVEFDCFEIKNLRDVLYKEITNLNLNFSPEFKDFEIVKPRVISHIAYRIWEKLNKPKSQDVEIWLEAENTWNFIRYMW